MIVILLTAISSALAALGVLTLAQPHQLHQARHDPLTGLATRLLWTARAERAVSGRTDVIVVMVDGDHVKSVNDAHGHDAGDRLISTLARLLESWAGPAAVVVARLGGDEGVLIGA